MQKSITLLIGFIFILTGMIIISRLTFPERAAAQAKVAGADLLIQVFPMHHAG